MRPEAGQLRGDARRADPPCVADGGDDEQVASERAIAVLEQAAAKQARLARQRDPGVDYRAAVRRDPCDDARNARTGEDLSGAEPALARAFAYGRDLDFIGEPADAGERHMAAIRPDQFEIVWLAARKVDREDQLSGERMVVDPDRIVEAGGDRAQLDVPSYSSPDDKASDESESNRDSAHSGPLTYM